MFDLHYDGKLFDSENLTVIVVCWAGRALENVWQYYGWAVTDELPGWSTRLNSGMTIFVPILFIIEQQNNNFVPLSHDSYSTLTNKRKKQSYECKQRHTQILHMALSHLIKDGDHWMIWHGPVSDSRIVLLCRLSIKSDSNYVICWRWVIGFEVSSYYHCTAGDRQDTNEYVTRSKTINSNTRYLYLQRQHWGKVVSG